MKTLHQKNTMPCHFNGLDTPRGYYAIRWVIHRLQKTRIMVSHIGHLVEKTHEELCEAAARYGMEVAYDGLEIEI